MFRDETSNGACSCEIEDFFYWIKLNNDIFQRSWSESVGYETWTPRGNLRWLRSSGPTVAMLWPPKAWKPFQLWRFLTSPVSCGELYQKNLLITTPLLCNEQTENKFVFHVAIYSQKISWQSYRTFARKPPCNSCHVKRKWRLKSWTKSCTVDLAAWCLGFQQR